MNFNRIGFKIAAGLLAFMLLLSAITATLVRAGFRQAEQSAVQRSESSLGNQSRATLAQLAAQEAQLYDFQLQRAARLAETAADYLARLHQSAKSFAGMPPGVVTRGSQLRLSADGTLYFDANPERRTEILHPGNHPPDAGTDRSLADSAPLEDLFPSLLAQSETGVGIYFQGPQLTFRYYPVRDLPRVEIENGAARAALQLTIDDFPVAPAKNPDRRTVWLSPYVDDAGQGLLISADAPVYYGDDFQGFIGIDVSLARLIEQINRLRPTAGSFAFLVDGEGRLVAVPPQGAAYLAGRPLSAAESAANTLLGKPLTEVNPQLEAVTRAAAGGQNGQAASLDLNLNGRATLVTLAALPDLGWTLAILAPLNEVTAESQKVANAIRTDGTRTVGGTLLVMILFFVAAGLVSILLSMRFITRPILQMLGGVRAITAGDLNVQVPVAANDELGELAQSFNRMTADLYRRTRELAQAGAELQIKDAQVKVAALEERQRLARELHDSVSQALYGIALGAKTARMQLDREPSQAAEPLDYILSLAEAGLSEMRALIFELRPESLQSEGLVAALGKQADALRARYHIDVRLDLCGEPDLPIEKKEALYRVAQEALHNIARHAHAARVDMLLRSQAGCLALEVRDDGRGFDPAGEFPGHLGLRSMRERIEKVGGELTIRSALGQGTIISVLLC